MKLEDDQVYFDLFFRALVGLRKRPGELAIALERGIPLEWENVYDVVNPFGDWRGRAFNSVWFFDLENDVLFLTKIDQFCSAPLELARTRKLTLDDFQSLDPPNDPAVEAQSLPSPYWEPELKPLPRAQSFQGRILQDFGHLWRHVLRRPMNTMTFMKLAYATIWISTLDLTLSERTGFDHSSPGKQYVYVTHLPEWEAPEAALVQAGSSWFALAQQLPDGLEIVRRHMKNHPPSRDSTANSRTYAILTLRHIAICKAQGSALVWTRPAPLFGDDIASNTAIDTILWATNTNRAEPKPCAINLLPLEIQDRILKYSTISLVSSAKLGYELGLGSTFSWVDRGLKIQVEARRRHRSEDPPVETYIFVNGAMSGLSYKRELKPLPAGWWSPVIRSQASNKS